MMLCQQVSADRPDFLFVVYAVTLHFLDQLKPSPMAPFDNLINLRLLFMACAYWNVVFNFG